jgi:hypothetical protein
MAHRVHQPLRARALLGEHVSSSSRPSSASVSAATLSRRWRNVGSGVDHVVHIVSPVLRPGNQQVGGDPASRNGSKLVNVRVPLWHPRTGRNPMRRLLDLADARLTSLPMMCSCSPPVARHLALSRVRARFFWLGRERDGAAHHAAVHLAIRDHRGSGAQRSGEYRAERDVAVAAAVSGRSSLIVVDDDSDDGTADVARRTAASLGAEQKLSIVESRTLRRTGPGKLWAVKQGRIAAAEEKLAPKYLLLTDADIVHAPGHR